VQKQKEFFLRSCTLSPSPPITPTHPAIRPSPLSPAPRVNRLLEDQSLGLLSSVTVDELHMVGDQERGYQLELLLTKLRYAGAAAYGEEGGDEAPGAGGAEGAEQGGAARDLEGGGGEPQGQLAARNGPQQQRWDAASLAEGVQVVGMSATLPNLGAVARWLGAALHVSHFRPVPLRQWVKVGRELQDPGGAVVRTLAPPPGWEASDPDLVAWLVGETVEEGHSVLLFCASKALCERSAKALAAALEVPERRRGRAPAPAPTRAAACAELRAVERHSPELVAAVARGVAFHHAGLCADQRRLVEGAYRSGAVSVLCATSTLAAGVNLPARRVIFRQPYIGLPSNPLDPTRYRWVVQPRARALSRAACRNAACELPPPPAASRPRHVSSSSPAAVFIARRRQMAGRAGRAGIDDAGEAILLADSAAAAPRLRALAAAEAAPVASCLGEGAKGMKRAMLEVVATGAVAQAADVERYIRCARRCRQCVCGGGALRRRPPPVFCVFDAPQAKR
jgi:DNA polymerase theta